MGEKRKSGDYHEFILAHISAVDNPIDSTTNESDYSLFAIRQATHACSLSRSSLIRLEERGGMLTPAYTDEKTGYHYYDNNNIARILQIQKFQWMGYSNEEIISYYEGSGKADALLATLEQKLSVLQQVAEMRLRSHDVPDMSLSVITIPETVCCVRRYQGAVVQNKYHASYDFFHECVARGIALAPEPFFIINERTDYL